MYFKKYLMLVLLTLLEFRKMLKHTKTTQMQINTIHILLSVR